MKDPSKETPIAGAVLFMLTGPILWAAHFMMVYSGQATICAWRSNGFLLLPQDYATALVITATFVVGASLVYAAWRPAEIARILRFDADDSGSQKFVTSIMQLLLYLSLFGVTSSGIAALIVDSCT